MGVKIPDKGTLFLRLKLLVPTSPRTSLTASKGGPHKLRPTSGMGQCLARHMSQGAEEWSDVVHQDVLMCPRQ